tara:strand:+ start:28664 stop:29482 length:819 start_codon:yes stop_codon:yes gene_type:complete
MMGLLLGILIPALGAARESARRVQCTDHLRELGLALHSEHGTTQHLPAGWKFDPTSQSAYGWVVPTLPYLGEAALAGRIDVSRTVDNSQHDIVRQVSLGVMLCPSDITEPTFMLFTDHDDDDAPRVGSTAITLPAVPRELFALPTANYVGVFGTLEPDDEIPAPIGDGAFIENRFVRFRDFQRGLSHTLVVGERTMSQVPSTWFGVSLLGEDAAARLVGAALEGINNPLADECDFSSRHPGGASFLWGDGHVQFVAQQIDLNHYHQLARLRN